MKTIPVLIIVLAVIVIYISPHPDAVKTAISPSIAAIALVISLYNKRGK